MTPCIPKLRSVEFCLALCIFDSHPMLHSLSLTLYVSKILSSTPIMIITVVFVTLDYNHCMYSDYSLYTVTASGHIIR